MRFIDLFAGLGGFHLALSRLGHECVFASEIKPKLQKLYKINFPDVSVKGDITKIKAEDIPPHEILCGGFPCQPFSFSGKKQGFDDELGRGNLFDEICRVLAYHHPKYIFLENVSALPGHDDGRTWMVIQQKLNDLGYDIDGRVFSPHEFGVPQHRPRFYIVGMLRDEQGNSGMRKFHFPQPDEKLVSDVRTVVDLMDNDALQPVRRSLHPVFDAWQEFVYNVTKRDGYMPSHCIFTMEFGADYEFEDTPPAFQPIERLRGRRGAYGKVLDGNTMEELIEDLPFYMQQTKYNVTYPEFKKVLIRQNRDL
jgi:DNA (cytosine-5)-methyltransferase 1